MKSHKDLNASPVPTYIPPQEVRRYTAPPSEGYDILRPIISPLTALIPTNVVLARCRNCCEVLWTMEEVMAGTNSHVCKLRPFDDLEMMGAQRDYHTKGSLQEWADAQKALVRARRMTPAVGVLVIPCEVEKGSCKDCRRDNAQ